MTRRTDFATFAMRCAEQSQQMKHPGEAYLAQHLGRFYETFQVCSQMVPQGAKTLSVGAGDAYVEQQLARAVGAQITVVDFPEAIRSREEDYRRHGFHTVAANLAGQPQFEVDGLFDVVLSFEVVEHLPIPPHQHIGSLSELLRPGGYFILTTPNMAHLPNVLRLLRGRSILPNAQLTFSPAIYENEHVHRREYVASELVEAMRQAGLRHEKTIYMSCRNLASLKGLLRRLYDLAPRWKKTLLLVGRKQPLHSACNVGQVAKVPEARQIGNLPHMSMLHFYCDGP